MKPQILLPSDLSGAHNADLAASGDRLARAGVYKDLSTIIIVPAFGSIPTKIVSAWWNMLTPPNQKVARLFAMGMEVGAAYSSTIEMILGNAELAKYRYILCLEHDNAPPPDGLVRILERAEAHPEFAAIGGLYWTKGEGGVPQIWGNPMESPLNFKPQRPVPGQLVECCGTGMGFNLWRMSMFRDEKLRRPWFHTQKENGVSTQDLYFWSDARKHGYRCAIDCSVRVGHYDHKGDFGIPDYTW